jgi:hypothetical protein
MLGSVLSHVRAVSGIRKRKSSKTTRQENEAGKSLREKETPDCQ